MTAFTAVLYWTVLVASVAYQVTQAKKMRKAAQAAAEARKGFELVAEGDVQPIPIIYGRAMVGGTRTWHEISSTFLWPPGGASRSRSARSQQLSSATTGIAARPCNAAKPAASAAGSSWGAKGCSTKTTP